MQLRVGKSTKSQIKHETKGAVCPDINQAVKRCPDDNQRRCTSCHCVASNYLTISDSWTLRGKVDESSTSAAAPLPDASRLCVWTVWFFWCAVTQWSLLRMRTDTVAQPGTIDKGYFYCAVWLEGKDNDYNTCIILKGFSCCLLPCMHIGSEAVVGQSNFDQLFKKTFALQWPIS